MLEQELNEFGRRMGLPGLSFSPDGLAALDVERMGRLHLEKGGKPGAEELLVYLARPCPAHDREAPERALELCHYRHPRPFPLSAGVQREATAAGMEKAVLMLADVMNKAVQGV